MIQYLYTELFFWNKIKNGNPTVNYNVGGFRPLKKFETAHKKAREFILSQYPSTDSRADAEPIREVVIKISELYVFSLKELLIETNRDFKYLGTEHPALLSNLKPTEKMLEKGLTVKGNYHLGKEYAYITGFLRESDSDTRLYFRSPLFKPDLIYSDT